MGKIISFLLIETSTGGPDEILKKVKQSPLVTESYIIYGEWDVIARCETNTLHDLTDFVVSIRKHPDVKDTKTLIATSG
ncbi:MAG: Lrp/AsnC family transcriptional regulator [Candidatus Lokiarchaeota archaeon]|nr:Lrp/AsnC family transcriptional regulator [Candidatus Lokiarchaeota archaeon]